MHCIQNVAQELMGILLFPILKVLCDLCVDWKSKSTEGWISGTMFLPQKYAVSNQTAPKETNFSLAFSKLELCLLWSLLSTPIGLMTFPELANT